MELCLRATTEQGLTDDELRAGLTALLERHPALYSPLHAIASTHLAYEQV